MRDWFSRIFNRNQNRMLTTSDANEDTQEKEVSYKNILNFENIKDSKIDISNVEIGTTNTFNYYTTNNYFGSEKDAVQNTESNIAKKVKQIEKLQEDFQYQSAIKSYNELLIDNIGKALNTNDTFLILNGILNCYINLNDKENVNKYIEKIENLSAVGDISKFHFLCAIFYLNQQDFDKAYMKIKEAIECRPDYFKALCLKILIECNLRVIDCNNAVNLLINSEEKPILGGGDDKDNAYVFNTLGDIYFYSKKFEDAIKYYSKANDIIPSPLERAHIGVSIFFKAVDNADDDKFIHQKNVDFKELNIAISIFDELYNLNDEEVGQTIKRQISPIYFKCLYLANRFGKINAIFDDLKDYCINEKSELYRLKAITEAIEGEISPETMKEISSEDQQWLNLISLMEYGKFERVISELEPLIWNKYKDSGQHHGMLLHAYLKADKTDERFVTHFKAYKDTGKVSEIVNFMEALYYEKNNNIAKAEKIIREVAYRTSEFTMYLELISFYKRNKLEDALENFFKDLFENKAHIVEFKKDSFYYKYFLFLFRNKKITTAVELYKNLRPSDLGEETFIKITAEIMFLVGDFKKSAVEYERLYDKTKNLEHLFSSLASYMRCNNTEKAEEIIKQLIYKDFKRKSMLYAIYSNIEILKNDIEKAYDYAKVAKELEKENPYSDIHPFYLSRSIRCNKQEGVAYVYEYASNYPKNDKWLKTFKSLEVDENGKEVPSKELLDFIRTRGKKFSELRDFYNERKLGVSTLAMLYHQTIPEILNWRQFSGAKVYITSGDIKEVGNEIDNISDKVAIDAFGLYILAEIGNLNILNHFERVYITYSTIESLQLIIMSFEDVKVRAILAFINSSLNIQFVYPDLDLVSQLNERLSNAFFKDQLDSVVYSYTNKIPYIYSDYFLKNDSVGYNNYLMNFVAFFRAMFRQGFINKETLSDVVLCLKKNQYDFINFDSEDLFNIAKKSDFELDENARLFFNFDKHCDIPSFVFVYLRFFKAIYTRIEREKFNKYICIYIDLFDKYIRKTLYYFHMLEMRFPEKQEEIEMLRLERSLTGVTIYQSFNSDLSNEYELNRIMYIMAISDGALRLLMSIFKDNAYFGNIRTLIPELFGHHIGIIRTVYRKHPDTLSS